MPKNTLTVICILAILISLIVIENNVIDKYCTNLYDDTKQFKNELKNNGNALLYIERIIDKWEKKKNIIYVFANHNTFHDIETAFYNVRYYVKIDNQKQALYHSEVLLQRVIELNGGFKFSLGNLL